ncbi:hypothetical protein MBOL_02610 [Mycobacteroides abscessus subsp. bolletii BD]|nr:hypothetical protein MBOL_02610 [Mycobacteroides abscessus subsp. bolletii BD]
MRQPLEDTFYDGLRKQDLVLGCVGDALHDLRGTRRAVEQQRCGDGALDSEAEPGGPSWAQSGAAKSRPTKTGPAKCAETGAGTFEACE